MKKDISGKVFTGAPDAEGVHQCLAMSIDDCEGDDELLQLYAREGRPLIEGMMPAEAFFSYDGELWRFEGSLCTDTSEVTIDKFYEIGVE